MHARTHWLLGDEREIDGADFYFGEDAVSKEIGHIHLDGEAHIFQAKPVAEALIAAKLARRFPWGRDIVVVRIEDAASVAHAKWVFQLSYHRRAGTSTKELLARVAAKVSPATLGA